MRSDSHTLASESTNSEMATMADEPTTLAAVIEAQAEALEMLRTKRGDSDRMVIEMEG